MDDARRDIDGLDEDLVIADMSGVDGLRPSTPSGPSRDIREELGSGEEQRMVIFGALRAGLSIGLVYIVGFAIAIAIMLWLWT